MAELYDQSQHDALQRLNQTLLQIDPYILPPYPNLSLVSGPQHPPLLQLTVAQLLAKQAEYYPDNECVIIPWTGARWTYHELWQQSNLLARALLRYGVRPRDRIGIMSGNCEKYVAVFFACARIGAICVTLNNTYTATESEYALKHTSECLCMYLPSQKLNHPGCRVLFTSEDIGRFDNRPLLKTLKDENISERLPDLKTICLIRGEDAGFMHYDSFVEEARSIPEHILEIFDGMISPYDVANLQFTSGSTGNPKAAMLTHQYVPSISEPKNGN